MTGSMTGLATFHNAFDLPRAPILHTGPHIISAVPTVR